MNELLQVWLASQLAKILKKVPVKCKIYSTSVKAVELSYVPLYHAVYSLYGAPYPNVYL